MKRETCSGLLTQFLMLQHQNGVRISIQHARTHIFYFTLIVIHKCWQPQRNQIFEAIKIQWSYAWQPNRMNLPLLVLLLLLLRFFHLLLSCVWLCMCVAAYERIESESERHESQSVEKQNVPPIILSYHFFIITDTHTQMFFFSFRKFKWK